MMGSRWLLTQYNNVLKVHSVTHEYNFRRIGHFLILLVAISKLRMNTNTEKAVYTPCKSLLKSFMDKNSPFSHSLKRNSLIIRVQRERESCLVIGERES